MQKYAAFKLIKDSFTHEWHYDTEPAFESDDIRKVFDFAYGCDVDVKIGEWDDYDKKWYETHM